MRGKSAQEFIDTLSYGMEQEFTFRGRTLCAQGWSEDGIVTIAVDQWDPPADDYVWMHRATRADECVEAFLAEPIFDGHTFWEVEGEIEVLYG